MRQSLAAALIVAGSFTAGHAGERAAPPARTAEDRNSDEFYEMLAAILTDARIGPGGGWMKCWRNSASIDPQVVRILWPPTI